MNTTDPMARAQELWEQYKHEMTLENTPRSQVDDEAGEDEWMSEGNRSGELEDLLAAHVRAHPETFRGTEFAYILDSAEGGWSDLPESYRWAPGPVPVATQAPADTAAETVIRGLLSSVVQTLEVAATVAETADPNATSYFDRPAFLRRVVGDLAGMAEASVLRTRGEGGT
jgi:hypothetical protein